MNNNKRSNYIARIGILQYTTYNTLYINILLFYYTLYAYLIICSISYVVYNGHVKNDFSRLFRFQVIIIYTYLYINIILYIIYNLNLILCDVMKYSFVIVIFYLGRHIGLIKVVAKYT